MKEMVQFIEFILITLLIKFEFIQFYYAFGTGRWIFKNP